MKTCSKHMWICTCKHKWICTCKRTWFCTCKRTWFCTCKHMQICTCKHALICTCKHADLYMKTYADLYMLICASVLLRTILSSSDELCTCDHYLCVCRHVCIHMIGCVLSGGAGLEGVWEDSHLLRLHHPIVADFDYHVATNQHIASAQGLMDHLLSW